MSTTVLFRNWNKKPTSPYDQCHGLYQADNGDLLFFGRITASEKADTVFDEIAKLPASIVTDFNPIIDALKEMGVTVTVGQRFRRKGRKTADAEAAKPEDQTTCSASVSDAPCSPATSATPPT